MANRRVENLTQERLEELAEREDTIVYTPEHKTIYCSIQVLAATGAQTGLCQTSRT